jgi:DNA-binding SARP family transcriptional activator
MPAFRLHLLGAPRIEGAAGPLAGPVAQRHRIALLALLCNAPRQLLSRDRLLGLLWPEMDEDRARRLLNESVHIIRQALGEKVLLTEGDALRLDPALLFCDVLEFEAALAHGDARTVIERYTGPFLEGLALPEAHEFEHWAEQERARLERTFHGALEQLAETAAREGRHRDALEGWPRCLACSPADGRVALQLMRALALAGDRAGALKVAAEHRTIMEEEFGVAPDPALQRFAEELRAGPALVPGPDTPELLPSDLELVRTLGEGSVAHVYLARESALARLVAVKVLRSQLAADDVASLSHRNVTTIHRVGRLEDNSDRSIRVSGSRFMRPRVRMRNARISPSVNGCSPLRATISS